MQEYGDDDGDDDEEKEDGEDDEPEALQTIALVGQATGSMKA